MYVKEQLIPTQFPLPPSLWGIANDNLKKQYVKDAFSHRKAVSNL